MNASLEVKSPPVGNVSSSKRKLRANISRASLLLFVLAAAYWVYQRYSHVYVSDARIAAPMYAISPNVSGWVSEIYVKEGQQVAKGDPLLSLDARASELKLLELNARQNAAAADTSQLAAKRKLLLAQLNSQSNTFQSRVNTADANVATSVSELALAQINFDRASKLLERKLIAKERWQEAQQSLQKSQKSHDAILTKVATANASLNEVNSRQLELAVIDQQLLSNQYHVEELSKQRQRLELDISDRTLLSPIDGVIDDSAIHVGEFARPGYRIMLLHNPQDVYVKTHIKETQLRYINKNSPVTVTVDAYPDTSFTGKIYAIADAATSQFSLLPNPNPSGNFTKITQRLTVKISIDQLSIGQKHNLLRPGMMVEVDIPIAGR